MAVIACPKCKRQYKVQGSPAGQRMKCPSCQSIFSVGQPAGPKAQVSTAAANKPIATEDAPPTSQAKLFPDTIPPGPDPLANHVIDDPGFVKVDIDQIKNERLAKVRKSKRYEADDPLQKFKREQREKQAEEENKKRKRKAGLKAALIGGVFYILLLAVATILAFNFEWGIYIILGLGIFALIFEFLADVMLIQYIKENDPEQYLYYIFLPPYRIYYWIVHWQDLMGFVLIEIVVGIPLIVNFWLLYYLDEKWGLGWFGG